MNWKRYLEYFFVLILYLIINIYVIYVAYFLATESLHLVIRFLMWGVIGIGLMDKYLFLDNYAKEYMKEFYKDNPVRKIKVIRRGG